MTRTRAFVDGVHDGRLLIDSGDGFSWDDAKTVAIQNPPHEKAFDTDRFYKIPVTAARPVEQTYSSAQGDVTMKKPPEELRSAAWSMDNTPVVLGHPQQRIVDSIDLIHGFVRNPQWDADDEALRGDVYVPTTDTRAKNYIEDNDGVSIGFWHEAEEAENDDDVDAYQRDLLIDHLAIVDEGRCSREDGCGLAADSVDGGLATRGFIAADEASCSSGDCGCGLHIANDEPHPQYRYSDEAKAEEASERLECEVGVHQHEDGDYMPCKSHDALDEALADGSDSEGAYGSDLAEGYRERADRYASDKTEAREARAEFRFETKEAAENATDELDCDGTHMHEKGNGVEVYMPCQDHDEFRQKFDENFGDEFEYDDSDNPEPDVDLSEQQTKAIKTIREEHTDMDKSEYKPRLGTLRRVYRRGIGAYRTSGAAPGATPQQWALARVKEFLRDLRNGNQLNSGADSDLAPDGYSSDAAYGTDAHEDVDLSPPDRVVNAVEAGMEAKEEYSDQIGDCGTGVGEAIGEKIVNDELTPDIMMNGGDIADNGGPTTYLPSHEGDVEPDGPPTSWSEDDWTGGCGEVQQALWGFYADWFEGKAEELESAKSEHSSDAKPDRATKDRHWTEYGQIGIDHQQSSRRVRVQMATAPSDFYVGIHDEGGEVVRQNVSAGGQLGREGPFTAYETHNMTVTLDDPVRESRTVYAVLYYADETGDMGDPIESQQGLIFDSATLMPTRTKVRRSSRDAVGTEVINEAMSGTGVYTQTNPFEVDKSMAGVEFDGTRDGDLDESEIPNDNYEPHYLYDGDTKSESSYPVVDGDGMLRRGNVQAAYSLGARGGVDADEHRRNLKKLNGEFDSPPIDGDDLTQDSTMNEEQIESGSVIDVADLTVDALAEKHEAVASLQEERDELENEAEVLNDRVESLEGELEGYRADEKEALVDEITSLTDAWSEDELLDLGLDDLEDKHEVATDIAASVDTGGSSEETPDVTTDTAESDSDGEYEVGEVYDLSHTA